MEALHTPINVALVEVVQESISVKKYHAHAYMLVATRCGVFQRCDHNASALA